MHAGVPPFGRETFDVGEDTGTPVSGDYAAKLPSLFTGTLENVTIELK